MTRLEWTDPAIADLTGAVAADNIDVIARSKRRSNPDCFASLAMTPTGLLAMTTRRRRASTNVTRSSSESACLDSVEPVCFP
jgi:hypothetical protein